MDSTSQKVLMVTLAQFADYTKDYQGKLNAEYHLLEPPIDNVFVLTLQFMEHNESPISRHSSFFMLISNCLKLLTMYVKMVHLGGNSWKQTQAPLYL